jgi:2-dehydropantoate 2-reductase
LAGGIDTAAIIGDENLGRVTLGLMEEVIDAANKCGYSLERTAANEQMTRTKTMGAYKPSTLLDFETRKPLEIEAIWGEPLRRATAAGVATPILETLYSLLKILDQTRKRRDEIVNHQP